MDAILVDVTKCTGCEKCVAACIEKNDLNLEKSFFDRETSRDGLSADRLLSIKKIDPGRFARFSCMHCTDPACVSACIVGGITKTKEGPVIYDPVKCIGCRYCMLACPFHIPRYEWSDTKPFMKKCNMCYDRIKENKQPACVQACPQKAIVFGERNNLIRQARLTINNNRNKYINHIWGQKEYGGTSVLYISDVDLTKMGWPVKYAVPIPEHTVPLIEKTPEIGLTVGGVLIGLNWVLRRKNELAAEKNKIKKLSEKSNSGE